MDENNETSATTNKRMPSGWVALIIIILVLLAGGAYFLFIAKNNSVLTYKTTGQQSATVTQSPAVSTPTVSANQTANTKQITVEGREFAFTPSTITVNKGDTVQITFKNMGTFPHNFTISDLGVKTKTIQPGEQDIITFMASKTGSFQFMCTVPGHADRGMVGTLTVK